MDTNIYDNISIKSCSDFLTSVVVIPQFNAENGQTSQSLKQLKQGMKKKPMLQSSCTELVHLTNQL